MWNFVTDHTSAVPSNLLDSALSIEDFRDEDLDDDDDLSYDRDSNPGTGGLGHEEGLQQQPVETTEEQRASDESFASLPTGTGIYRVQYTFAAEAPQEMDVNEGGKSPDSPIIGLLAINKLTQVIIRIDHVRVWQQLCDGWVLGAKVVQKSPSSDTQDGRVEYAEICNGLVPQSYLMFSHTVTLTSSENDETSNGDKATCYYFP